MESPRLRVPARLLFVVLTGATTLACSSSDEKTDASTDGPSDADLDSGLCTVKPEKGEVCESTCYNQVSPSMAVPVDCSAYCKIPKPGETTPCFQLDGAPYIAGCSLTRYDDGGMRVLC